MSESSAGHSIADYQRGYESDGHLRGFRSVCGFVTATWSLACPQCGKRDLEELLLSGAGRVAAFTVQNVPGDEFLNEAPYAYVVVELAEGGRVTGWMDSVHSEDDLAIGDAVRFAPTYKPGVHFEKVGRAGGDSGET